LTLAARDPAVQVRAAALEAWASIAGAEAFAVIERALGSDALSERGSAVAALESRSEPDVPRLAWDTYLASAGEKWTELREELVKRLAAYPGEDTTAQLKRALADPAASVSGLARQALLARGATDLPAPAPSALTYSPYRELRFRRDPHVVLHTSRGEIELELFAREAPIHVANLVGFIRAGRYDGLPVHRVVPNFVIQGGDPDGSGWGGAGYAVRAEVNSRRFSRGALGMPRSQGFDTGGVQFFIVHIPSPHLDGQYTVFGQVVRGLDVVDDIEAGDVVLRATAFEPDSEMHPSPCPSHTLAGSCVPQTR
jgi:cyclophilin family peptidyl-prolyl cis-trans isomerase